MRVLRNMVGTAVGTFVGFAFAWVSCAVILKELHPEDSFIITFVWLTAIAVGLVIAIVLRRLISGSVSEE
jgi:hypothetical protein